MLSLQNAIAQKVIFAQIASDAGKGNHRLHIKGDDFAHRRGYLVKDKLIKQAIALISNNPLCGWNFFEIGGKDQNGYGSIITYFEYKDRDTGRRYQMSFHTPCRSLKKLKTSKGRKTRWTGNVGQSAEDCRDLAILFHL